MRERDRSIGPRVSADHQPPNCSLSLSLCLPPRMQLANHSPSKLIVLDSERSRKVISSSVNEATASLYRQVALPRKCFDDTSAIHYLSRVSEEDESAMRSENQKKYYMALSSAAALINYLKNQCHVEPNNVKIHFTGPSTHLMIDYSTLVSLELLEACQYHNQNNAHLKYASLLSTINHTRTAGGKKMLKKSLVQPLKDIDTIRARQEAVKELVGDQELLRNLRELMEQVPRDHEAICLQFATSFPSLKADKSKWISQTISKLVRLRTFLQLLPKLGEELGKSKSLLLQAIFTAASSANVSTILALLEEILVDKNAEEEEIQNNITHQIFMVKCDDNSVLDIARKDFYQISQQVHELAEEYRTSLGLKKLKLHFTPKRKFHLAMGRKVLESEHAEGLPEILIPLQTSQANYLYSTLELNVLNSRLQTALNDCFEILTGAIEALTDQVRGKLSHLRVQVEAISMLDLICSFAILAGENSGSYSCPDMERDGPLLIVEGKHPLLPQDQGNVQGNSTLLSEHRSFEIISGPNMAGKSTYSRQVGLIVILAHMGCFVPAKYARVPLFSSILTRCTARKDSGSIEDNLSSFYMEMQDIARITKSLSQASLVIVDEIGRSTSDADGKAIAWSVAEYLLSQRVFSIFISHYEIFKQMPFCSPRSLHRTFSTGNGTGPHHLEENLSGAEEALEARQYGIDLAEAIGYPKEIIDVARHLSSVVTQSKVDSCNQAAGDQSIRRRIQAYDHLQVLSLLSSKSKLDDETLRDQLWALQQELRKAH